MATRAERGRSAERRGRGAEDVAALYLRCKFYRILARRWRSPAGEIDLIAQNLAGTFCFIEVKTRHDPDQAILSVHQAQRQRIERAAASYLAGRKTIAGVRFDVISVSGFRLRHIRDAWRPGDARRR